MSTDGSTDKPRRRVISVAEKLAHLEAYDQAIQTQQGGAYLRANGLYSSQIAQWRKQSDAGMFDDKQPGQSVGKPTKEQAEIARLKRQLADRERDLEKPPRLLWILWEKRTRVRREVAHFQ